METIEVRSADGTVLGAEVVGEGPPLLLVHGGTADRTRWAPLVPLLAPDHQLVLLDRRGRGLSTDEAEEYALEREGEDVLAVLAALDRPAGVLAHSYGATCTLSALDAVAAVCPVVLYEPPFSTPGSLAVPPELLDRMAAALAEGRREDVLVSFYRDVLGFGDDAVAALRAMPVWQARLAAVHTIVREGHEVNRFAPGPTGARFRLLVGDATAPFLAAAARRLAEVAPAADVHVLAGQGHVAIDTAPELVARHVREACADLTAA